MNFLKFLGSGQTITSSSTEEFMCSKKTPLQEPIFNKTATEA
jgi:hypothetical protein